MLVTIQPRLLLASDTNTTRLYAFTAQGQIIPKPMATNDDLAPDTASPVVMNGLVYAPSGGLICLDATAGLKTLWRLDNEEGLNGFASLIAGDDRLLVFTQHGLLYLLDTQGKKYKILGHQELCGDTLSHPALANGFLYVRDAKWVYCYKMK